MALPYSKLTTEEEQPPKRNWRYVDAPVPVNGVNLATADTAASKVYNLGLPVVTDFSGSGGATSHSAAGDELLSPTHRTALDAPAPVQPIAGPNGGINIATVEARRNAILSGTDPDAPAIWVSPERKAALNHELGLLTNIAHAHALETAANQHEVYRQNKDIAAARSFTDLAKGLQSIPHAPGTPEYQKAFLQVVADNPAGVMAPAGRELVKLHAKEHDSHAAIKGVVAGANAPASQYYSAEALLKENPGVAYRQDPKTGGFVVTKGKGEAEEPAVQYSTSAALLAENPGAKYRQDPKSGGFIVTQGSDPNAKGEAPATQYATSAALLSENPGAKYKQDPKTGGYYVHIGGTGKAPTVPGVTSDSEEKQIKDTYGVNTAAIKNATGVQEGNFTNGKFVGKAGGDSVRFPNPKDQKKFVVMPKREWERIRGGSQVPSPEEQIQKDLASKTITPEQAKEKLNAIGFTPSASVPKAGDIEEGYKFKGGDPKDRSNWEKI